VTSLSGVENLLSLEMLLANGCAIDDESASHLTSLTSITTLELVIHSEHMRCSRIDSEEGKCRRRRRKKKKKKKKEEEEEEERRKKKEEE
jgi:hypothetical protein